MTECGGFHVGYILVLRGVECSATSHFRFTLRKKPQYELKTELCGLRILDCCFVRGKTSYHYRKKK
jgi:hypothetical protein